MSTIELWDMLILGAITADFLLLAALPDVIF